MPAIGDQSTDASGGAYRKGDGTKVWLHAVIDNFSRKVLAWRVAERFDTSNAVAVLQAAVRSAVSRQGPPQLVADGGVENFNAGDTGTVGGGEASREAQTAGV